MAGGTMHHRGAKGLAIVLLATIAAILGSPARDSGAAPLAARRYSTCQVPPLIGHSLGEAVRRAARAHCAIRIRDATTGAPIDVLTEPQAAARLVSRQQPQAGREAELVTAWVRPLCDESADPGPGIDEPRITPGPTTLVSGLFLDGGPLRRVGRCTRGTPSPGTIQVLDPSTGQQVASSTVAAGKLARIRLAPGAYEVEGTFANAFRNGQPITTLPRRVTLRAGTVVREDVIASIR
ncbi:MAG TPA: hypothetical protein VMD79_03320 [Solirubrobacteraceae bacterium]|nr:hypothetical protein [Solirubrobacteraceae bacterium]